MKSASAMRTALTEDLESRGQRSQIRAVRYAITHMNQGRAAGAWLRSIAERGKRKPPAATAEESAAQKSLDPPVHHLTEDEQHMAGVPDPPPDSRGGRPSASE